MRKINVNDKIYEYTIGKSFLKVKGYPAIELHKLVGMTKEGFEIQRKAGFKSGMVTPQSVKHFIEGQK